MIHKRSSTRNNQLKYYTEGLKPVSRRTKLTLSLDVDQDTQMFGLHPLRTLPEWYNIVHLTPDLLIKMLTLNILGPTRLFGWF